jgi:site-specific DNA-methyltransferase (adenine-specific)
LFRIVEVGGVIVWIVKDSIINGDKSLTSFKQCLFFQEIGFKVYDIIIYSKRSSSLPHKSRYFDTYEFMFILSKLNIPKSINLIKDRKNKYAGTSGWGKQNVREKNGNLTYRSKPIRKLYGTRFNIWDYVVGYKHSTKDKIAFDHPAIFPENLVRDHIYTWSNENDIVLDPMNGSGTTTKMAYLMNRKFIGIDISEKYCDIARKRLNLYKNEKKPQSYWNNILNPSSNKIRIKKNTNSFI